MGNGRRLGGILGDPTMATFISAVANHWQLERGVENEQWRSYLSFYTVDNRPVGKR
jgi:hypothetical protein